MWYIQNQNELCHHGILGMKWGVRRYQNPDGTLTAAGRRKYKTESRFYAEQNYKQAKAARKSVNKKPGSTAKKVAVAAGVTAVGVLAAKTAVSAGKAALLATAANEASQLYRKHEREIKNVVRQSATKTVGELGGLASKGARAVRSFGSSVRSGRPHG